MYSIKLNQYKDVSFINLLENNWQKETIAFNKNIHKYQSSSSFNLLKSELNTYGDKAMIELFNYFKNKHE